MNIRTIAIGLIVTCLLIVPRSTHADQAPLSCSPGEKLHVVRAAEVAAPIAGMFIPVGCTMRISSGLTLQFQNYTQIDVQGRLEVLGQEQAPILFTGSASWKGLVAEQGSVVVLHAAVFEHAHNGVILNEAQLEMSDVSLIDGYSNMILLIHPRGIESDQFTINRLRFYNRDKGDAMGGDGLDVVEPQFLFYVNNLELQDNREIIPKTTLLGVLVVAPKVGYYISHAYQGACALVAVENQANQQYFQHDSECVPNRAPVVFVPGYATSFTQLLSTLDAQHIPHVTAYYDWRAPATEAEKLYLEPAINQAKQLYHANRVVLMAHSFGGIVSQAYITSDSYRDDVAQLIEFGTPNQGSLKAYAPWEAAEFPPDWAPANALLNYYQSSFDVYGASPRAAVQHFFPSLLELQPIYPALRLRNVYLDPSTFAPQNRLLLQLRALRHRLEMRVAVTTFYSKSEPTLESYDVIHPISPPQWFDGEPASTQPALSKVGDTTVVMQSAILEGAKQIEVTGEHQQLPALGVPYLPGMVSPSLLATRYVPKVVWFFFDCPVRVNITLPDGEIRDSDQPDNGGQPGSVLQSPEMLWMALPQEAGQYTVNVTATADTQVRSWVNNGPITVVQLAEGQHVQYPVTVVPLPAAKATPSPSASPELAASATTTDSGPPSGAVWSRVALPPSFSTIAQLVTTLATAPQTAPAADHPNAPPIVFLLYQTTTKRWNRLLILVGLGIGCAMLLRWRK